MATQMMPSAELDDHRLVIYPEFHETNMAECGRPMAPARGIIAGVLVSIPLWALIIFVLHKLL